MSLQVAPLGQDLRQLLTNSLWHVALKSGPQETNLLPMMGVKLLPKLPPLVPLCQLLTPASLSPDFSGMSDTLQSSPRCLAEISFLDLKRGREG